MHAMRPALFLTVLSLLAASPALAAVKIKLPEAEPDGATARTRPVPDAKEGEIVGSVIYVQGGQVVAEIEGSARPKERLIVLDGNLRPRGYVAVVRPLEAATYLLQPLGSFGIEIGNRLTRETERQAAARVLKTDRPEAYREFLELFPDSPYLPRIGRAMFRLAIDAAYPAEPGSTVSGSIRLAEEVGRQVSLAGARIAVDRFVLTTTDEDGRFRIEGLPPLKGPAQVVVRVSDPKFQMPEEIFINLPAQEAVEIEVELPVVVTPTVLFGRVVDANGAPLPGVEVWTYPYSSEVLTDDRGEYRISRRKSTSNDGGDLPLFGSEFEVYALRRGYGVERVQVSAESYRENEAPDLQLARQDPKGEPLPHPGLDLREYLFITTAPAAAQPDN